MNVVSYVRVSTAQQDDEDRYGIAAQREAIEKHCAEHGYTIVHEYRDTGSGTTPDRAGLKAMVSAAGAKEWEKIVVARGDRLARDAMLDGYLRYTFKEMDVSIESASETNGTDPLTTLMQGILAAIAGYERSLITARLAAARRLKHAQGGYAGGQQPLGYKATGEGDLVPDKKEQLVLNLILRRHSEGDSLRDIAKRLNRQHIRTKNGGRKWYANTVRSVLRTSKRSEGYQPNNPAPWTR